MSPGGWKIQHRGLPHRSVDRPEIPAFLVPSDVGKLRPSDSLAPGAFEAVRRGCTCDRIANEYGKGESNGFLGDARRHLINERCPLHGSSIESVPTQPQRCPHCGLDLKLTDDGKRVSCANECEVLVVGPPEPAPRTGPAICTRCNKPITRAPGQLGRTPKYHPECLTPAERNDIAYKNRYNAQVRERKRAQDGDA